ncbi:MAG: inositol monophosphatase family protein [candidate division NC10 bacterium]|nr:inositol monophosphatase [candidate division NC10 bacterium]MCZ6550020.1 inositol monophosphatase family protein [candidate division NC10 bacterium]
MTLEDREHLEAARVAAKEAGRILMERFGRRPQVYYKGRINLVTDVDRRSEASIVSFLHRRFPDHTILSEEGQGHVGKGETCWIVDPLDGTTNYAHGFPFFAVSIALEHQGKLRCGVVYDPLREEWFTAVHDGGAYLNEEPIHVSDTDQLEEALLATGFPYDMRESPENNLNHFSNFSMRAQAVRRPGVASIDLAYVAAGRLDGFWELKLKAWDIAAGALLVAEAGGTVTDFGGGQLDIYRPEIVASNPHIHDAILQVLSLPRSS